VYLGYVESPSASVLDAGVVMVTVC
jgi:hypothetical protein